MSAEIESNCRGNVTLAFGEPITSAVMFSAGVVVNILALALLEIRRRRTSRSLYQILVTALLLTDLLGSISVSPVVLSAYAQNLTLLGMSKNKELCFYFGFSMTFLSLCTLSILCVMALERYFSIGHPYFYERHVSKRSVGITVVVIYLGSMFFCISPFLGFGKRYVQYCPGTWCFLEMNQTDGNNKYYIGFYASFILIIISTTVVCNINVIVLLVRMYRRGKVRRSRVAAQSRYHRSLSLTEEVEHLLPLIITTGVFICCTFPLVVRVYVNLRGSHGNQHKADLRALRLLSFHSIINPWVFIILRPSVLKILWSYLHKPHMSTFTWGKNVSSQTNQTACCKATEAEKCG